MSQQTLNIDHLYMLNGPAANWQTKNPVLGKGEFGIEIDTGLFKIGDGVTAWNDLKYGGTLVAKSTQNGYVLINGVDTQVYALPVAGASLGGIKSESGAGKVSVASDGTASVESIDVTAVNGVGTAAVKDTGTASGNVPVLDANGKLDTSVIPALAITDVNTVTDEAAMLALTDVQKGDVAVRSDGTGTWILIADDASKLANWVQLKAPTDVVTSVNGKNGAVVLSTSDVAEGSNLYYTEARFDARFKTSSSTGLSDSDSLIRNTDTLILNCGTV